MSPSTQRHALTLRHLLFGWLNLAITAPAIYLWLGLPLILRQQGWSGTAIGLFQLAGLPALFKFVLALPVEHHRAGHASYRNWAMLLLVAYAAALFALGWQPLWQQREALFALAFAAALLATWVDIPINALAIRILPPGERLHAGGIRSMAMSLAAIVGGGLMLLLQTRHGWQAPFMVMIAMLFVGVAALALLGGGEVEASAVPVERPAAPLREVVAYFAPATTKRWTVLLLLYFPFIAAAWFYLKPILLDHGFTAEQVAWIAGIGGGTVAALASLGAGRVAARIGASHALPGFALLNLLALGSLGLAVWLNAASWLFIAAALLVAASMGASAALAFGLTMAFARPVREAMDYGIQSSLFAAGRLAVPVGAGAMLDYGGHGGLLALLSGAAALVALLSVHWRQLAGLGHGTPPA